MPRFEVTVNIDGLGIRKHVIKARTQDKMAEKLGRSYPKEEYRVMRIVKLKRENER